ncbi:MAG: 16S rRNA (cytidine(1402)-2'-O)-methyltransferase [Pseudomonadota bacterium]|nr:16S rRNA (cytidine(1402)-2'-O)-methyltransferase [Pseudomonadota bacterium]
MDVSIERPAVYVVATPIGNLGDMGRRAAEILDAVDFILSEDTRHSRKLLEAYGVTTSLRPLHDHNEGRMAERVVADLEATREACALISDAGTPLISDPGYALVNCAVAASIPVLTVPGPCAVTAALSVSGMPTDRFAFEGFLPARAPAREERLRHLVQESRTLVFFEAPHRILDTLNAMIAVFGGARGAVIARELTKKFEAVYRGSLAELSELLQSEPNTSRGEIVLVIAGRQRHPDTREAERVIQILLEEMDSKTAIRVAKAITGLSRNLLYEAALRTNGHEDDVEI